ncbi:TetR/AcrR family transcriptional regulator [Sandaracinus amylolyticus]|uniref:Transcriptional regulator, TetR family protein n=1 Tax=Sandaracinus amylolyticus TaxID=927083 RepID=A0A0F6W779_9BACT|nr:TetR-like C-terminal domain-containing protein [Sandaracinus amylolyticus]AKF09077.1 Transcriptional regulator, TetR family protein [Sandaracinus amylolyticus]
MRSSRTDEVVDVAIALVEAEGEEGLGWNRVARALGVKPPSLYNHVESGADLRRRVAIRGWERWEDDARRAIARSRGPRAQLRALATSYRTFAHEHGALFAVLGSTRIAPDDPDFRPVAGRLLALFEAPLAELGVPAAKRVHAIRTVRSIVHGFVHLEAAGQLAMDASIDASFRYAIELLLDGLTSE